ncbi:MAG TPA: glycosyltransferase family 4 protein [Pseudomonadales bacterium]|nr:glycosyltransferase family 4 protein [Pseudomonadales bacterium]
MRILIFIYSMGSGGAERVTSHLANAWAEMGRDVTVVTLTSLKGDMYVLHPNVKRIGLDLALESTGVVSALSGNVRRIFALRTVLRQLNPDVVIGMMTTASVLAVLAAFGLKCRVIISERTYPLLSPLDRFWSVLRRVVYPWADYVVAQSNESEQWFREHSGCRRIAVIPNPVVWPLSTGAPVVLPDSVLNSNSYLLLAVGRLGEEKGFDVLVDAFAGIAARCPLWNLVILGEGQQRDKLMEQIKKSGYESRVHLPGRAGNMADWYGRADLYVMTSRFEGFPNTLLEAMAAGCAAVSFDCDTGPRDIIKQDINGLLVRPVGDVDLMAEALLSLMTSDSERERMGQNALLVRDQFSMRRILSLWDKVINA